MRPDPEARGGSAHVVPEWGSHRRGRAGRCGVERKSWRADRPKANWLTDGDDPERTSWQRNETLIGPATVGHMKLIWKVRLDNQPRQMHNLFPPLIASDVETAQGRRELAIVAGVSDNIYGIDVETGTQIWKRQFDSTFKDDGSTRAYMLCPGGLTATPIIVPGGDAREVHGLRDLVGRPAAQRLMPPRARELARRAVPAGQRQAVRPELPQQRPLHDDRAGLRRQPEPVLLVRPGDEEGRQLQSGQRRAVAAPRAVDRQGRQRVCRQRRRRLLSGAADLRAGDHRGQAEPADQSDGDDRLVRAVNAYWLRKRDLDMNVTGPVFEYKGSEYTAQSSKECRIWLLDTSALGGEDHRTPVYQTPLVCNEEVHFAGAGPWGALATWEDTDGTRWVLMPFWGPKHSEVHGADRARPGVAGRGGGVQGGGARHRSAAVPAWLSRNMVKADPVVIANGVVFAYGSGEDATQATVDIGLAYNTAANRIARSSHATLYALDARTARSSGRAATRSRPSTTSPACRWPTDACTSARSTAYLYCFGVDGAAGTK